MKYIPLTKGKQAIVDDEDYDWLSQWRWCITGKYAARGQWLTKAKLTTIYMHCEIHQAPKGLYADHINGDPLDNRRANLRPVSHQQNSMNRKLSAKSTSGYRGVTWHKDRRQWYAQIGFEGRRIYLGLFPTIEEAAIAYDIAAIQLFGAYANTSIVPYN